MDLVGARGIESRRGSLLDEVVDQPYSALLAGSVRTLFHYDQAAVRQVVSGRLGRLRRRGGIERAGNQQCGDLGANRRMEIAGERAGRSPGLAAFLIAA